MRKSLLILIATIIVVGTLVAAGTLINFEKPQKGIYSGPGVPESKAYSITIGANDSYCAIPIHVNTTKSYYINMSVQTISNAGSSTGQFDGLMNQTDYELFTSNDSMKFLVSNAIDYSYSGQGNQTYYAVFLNTLSIVIEENLVISVDISTSSK